MLREKDAVAKVVCEIQRVPENKDEEGVAKKEGLRKETQKWMLS